MITDSGAGYEQPMTGRIVRGVLAGAAGVTALNAATYLDMAWRGRPASTAAEDTVDTLTRRWGHPVPGEGQARDSRLTGLGALTGIATSVSVATAFSLVRATRWLPRPVGPLVIGGAAMAATDVSMTRLGVTDPRTWSTGDWLADILPHLTFGTVVWAALNRRRHRS